jgi:hypothetical protein
MGHPYLKPFMIKKIDFSKDLADISIYYDNNKSGNGKDV